MKFTLNAKSVIIGMIIAIIAIYAGWHKGLQQRTEVESEDMPLSQWKAVAMTITAYCPCEKCCGKYSDGITASGHRIQRGDKFVAADKYFPFGTEIIVIGYNNNEPVEVLDRGGKIKGNHIDLFFPTHQKALNWGRKKGWVYVPNT